VPPVSMVLLARRWRKSSELIALATRSNNDRPAEAFSLRDLLWFVTTCGAYFAQFAALFQLGEQSWRRCAYGVLAAWLVLGALLLVKGVRGMIVAHCIGPVVALFIKLLASGSSGLVVSGFSFEGVLAVGCFVSSLISFPASVVNSVAIAVRLRSRPDRSTVEDDSNMT
jgi:hypothetical protein